ncbi:MAG: hypothetical protein QXS21_01225 [Thermoproteota archaeon]|nr:hypothetical protein [Candidatus Brockarchaeota archaeon]MBO3762761.1 hypothetical protein [Candidatus Brockarchaeota archaeon]MBO3768526.1 hypothetical protein [Candidatus Brockarchaeota archaeon]MBO3801332.1 hypothetical protein [Candidatus Brockarchaeota archaeon]
MKISLIKIVVIAAIGVFIVALMPYIIGGTFMKPQSPEAKIVVDTATVQLSSGIFSNDYFFSILGTSLLAYQLLATPLGYSGNTISGAIASGMYSTINPQWQYIALALAIAFGLIATITSRNLSESAVGMLVGYFASSALQLYLAGNLLASLGLSSSKQAMAFNAVLAFLTSSNLFYLLLSLLVSFAIVKYVFPPRVIPLQEKKIKLASEVTVATPKKEEIEIKPEIKPVEVAVPKEETKTQAQVSEVTPFEVTSELEKEEKPKAKLKTPEEHKEIVEEVKKETKVQAPEQKVEGEEIKPVEEKAEEVIELPEELFKSIEQSKIKAQEEKPEQVEIPIKKEAISVEESAITPPLKEEVTKKTVEEKVYEEKREPSVIISELEKPLKELQDKKYFTEIEDKLKINLYCNICGYKLVWNEEEGRYECPVCREIQ